MVTHPTTRHHGDVIATYVCMSQRRRRYVSNETANKVLMERGQDVSGLRLYDILLEHRDEISRRCNNDA